jgi:hypothetical protein
VPLVLAIGIGLFSGVVLSRCSSSVEPQIRTSTFQALGEPDIVNNELIRSGGVCYNFKLHEFLRKRLKHYVILNIGGENM